MIFPLRNAHGAAAVLASLLFSVTAQAQNELWVLNETPPSLGRVDLTSFAYQEVLSFEDAGFATDLEIQDDAAVVVLENRVVKVDLMSGQIVADTELLGAQEAALFEDGTVTSRTGPCTEKGLPRQRPGPPTAEARARRPGRQGARAQARSV